MWLIQLTPTTFAAFIWDHGRSLYLGTFDLQHDTNYLQGVID